MGQQGELVTFLFTDVEGSTGLLQRLGEQYGPVLAAVRQILRGVVAAHGGREIDTRGDELFACFEEPRRALEAALAAQRSLLAREWPAGERVRVRMGLHTGRASVSDGGFVGLDVHRAARIASAAHGGQVLLSGASAALLRDAPLEELGEHELPGLPAPEPIFQLAADDLPGEFPPLRNARPLRPAVRVVIADDSVLLREGIARLLEDTAMEVAAQSGTAEDLLSEVEQHDPDIAIVDIRMPPTQTDEGLRAAHTIRERFPRTAVLVLSQYVEPAYALELLSGSAAGVGYLLKDRIADVDEFADAVRRVADGGSAVDPEVVQALVGRGQSAVATLSPRERDVLALLAQGRSNAAIAERLFLAAADVEEAVEAIYEKLRLPAGADERHRVLAVLALLST
jgi:DNA-binding NarL/FixJ family response regulator/class 3 adenylate cyclase